MFHRNCVGFVAPEQPCSSPASSLAERSGARDFLFSRSLTHGDGACSPLNISAPQQSSPRDTTPQRIPLDCLKAKRRTPEAPPPPGAASRVEVTSQIPPHPWACGAPTIHQLHHQMSVLLFIEVICHLSFVVLIETFNALEIISSQMSCSWKAHMLISMGF